MFDTEDEIWAYLSDNEDESVALHNAGHTAYLYFDESGEQTAILEREGGELITTVELAPEQDLSKYESEVVAASDVPEQNS